MNKKQYIEYYKTAHKKYYTEINNMLKKISWYLGLKIEHWELIIDVDIILTNSANWLKFNWLYAPRIVLWWSMKWDIYYKSSEIKDLLVGYAEKACRLTKEYHSITNDLYENYEWKRDSHFLNIPAYISSWLL